MKPTVSVILLCLLFCGCPFSSDGSKYPPEVVGVDWLISKVDTSGWSMTKGWLLVPDYEVTDAELSNGSVIGKSTPLGLRFYRKLVPSSWVLWVDYNPKTNLYDLEKKYIWDDFDGDGFLDYRMLIKGPDDDEFSDAGGNDGFGVNGNTTNPIN